ncbi:hypothetical protein U27_03140 [Candidatus Vecturithrix granuli]|uniref:Uncharacterized protein n=1 Tax=Vecturithrix granuli TaxID=1499967 RepID=A0A081BV23_VECG1|nr:hypothetical protein U27_03140 [Candidatus Vecturithrix granuli]
MKKKPLIYKMRGAWSGNLRKLDKIDVFRCRPFFSFSNLKYNAIPFVQLLKTGSDNFAIMHKNILSVILFDKPVTFLLIKPFYCTLYQFTSPTKKLFILLTLPNEKACIFEKGGATFHCQFTNLTNFRYHYAREKRECQEKKRVP